MAQPGQEAESAKKASVHVPDWKLYEKDVGDRGRGVFPGVDIPAGQIVIKFEGPIYDKETCPEFSEALQVGVNAWMWSSGGLDDLVNHSCDPNLGLWQVDGNTYLIALRLIPAHAELFFDYSTSMVDEPWQLDGCLCGTGKCRGVIANFLDLPPAVMQYYAGMGTLPEHVWVTAAARGVELARGSLLDTASAGPAAGSDVSTA